MCKKYWCGVLFYICPPTFFVFSSSLPCALYSLSYLLWDEVQSFVKNLWKTLLTAQRSDFFCFSKQWYCDWQTIQSFCFGEMKFYICPNTKVPFGIKTKTHQKKVMKKNNNKKKKKKKQQQKNKQKPMVAI